MQLKKILWVVFLLVLGVVISSYFVGSLFLTRVIPKPFESSGSVTEINTVYTGISSLFADKDLVGGWVPWIIRQVSILIGALSLIIFFYAGMNLIIKGDNEEEFGKAMKMIIYAIVGIALAAFSYTIVANVLVLF